MTGKREGAIDLRSLKGAPGLCGLGPLEGLIGEVTIIDGRPSLARVGVDGAPVVTESFEGNAPFFVWAEVTGAWRTRQTPSEVRTLHDLEAFIERAGAEAGLTDAFPFKLVSPASPLRYHVLDAKPGHQPGMAGHGAMQTKLEMGPQPALLVGFHSKRHHGIFTHMNSNMHLHFMTPDNQISGHVDDMTIASGLTLSLPSAG